MKDRIAHLLVRLAERLCPTFELKPTYEAKEIAIAVAITKKNIRQYRSSYGGKCSYRKGVSDTEKIQRGNNHSHIFEAIERNGLIVDNVYVKDGERIVESRLKVYVRKKEV
jgi:hypothetical protein|nr:MAG TPA: hypothetical protein [Caudoviricetes sp.]DAW80118.1 MAG TPA: hypothetical protein [Caudoviricetes sp.]